MKFFLHGEDILVFLWRFWGVMENSKNLKIVGGFYGMMGKSKAL